MTSIAPLSCSPEATHEQLLFAALRGDQCAWENLVNRLDRYLATAVRRRAPDLPEDLRQDVIQEVWAEAATRPDGDFDPSKRSAQHYIAGFLGIGLDRVRATNRAPGERSRRRDAARSAAARLPGPCHLVSLDELHEDDQPVDPRCRGEQERVEAAIDINRARALASPVGARAIDAMWHDDLGFKSAAAAAGINRLTLRRQLRQLGIRLAA